MSMTPTTETTTRRAALWAASYYDASIPPDLLGPPEAPVLDALDPDTITVGPPPTPLVITGSNFNANSKVWADEEAQLTTFVSDTELTYNAEADREGTQTITVRHGGLSSDAIELTVAADEGRSVESPAPEPDPDDEPDPEDEPGDEED
jgi:hypothetical protein